MKSIICEMCGSTDVLKQDGVFVCQVCGTKYSVEEAKKMMIEGTVEVTGTVKVDNSVFIEKQLMNARRAKAKEDWEETEKYYNLVEQHSPTNIEALFYSAYGKARATLIDKDINKRSAAFNILGNSISVVDDNFDKSALNSQTDLVKQISDDLLTMYKSDFTKAVIGNNQNGDYHEGGKGYHTAALFKTVCEKFIETLENIIRDNPTSNTKLSSCVNEHKNMLSSFQTSNCYIATAVYGSYDCPQVWTLRRYRDDTLAETALGRVFIRTYYAISPTLVKWFGKTKWFQHLWRGRLDLLVAKLKAQGVEDSEYEDRKW